MNQFAYRGVIADAFSFIENKQLLDVQLWQRFVQQFREEADADSGWRGEFWGKMMRGATFVYSYSQNPQLYDVLTHTVQELMDSQDTMGRICTYPLASEFGGWDMWCRKYVLLGMDYYLNICKDPVFAQKVLDAMCTQLDYIIAHVGEEEGKISIVHTCNLWRGLNSCSILEAVVKLYNRTGRQEYLQFAKYIVDWGGTEIENLFQLAYENRIPPYRYPITKAYEMISCFEGLLEYYKVTGIEQYKTALIHFADSILETDFTVVGSAGCTHELFDHSTVRQANTTNGAIAQETCVTVTLMKFMARMHLLTGKQAYVEAFETSLYNAYLGALNTNDVVDPSILEKHPDWIAEPLPFDSYSPLVAGRRGNLVGGLRPTSDGHYYGCCACIGSAGIGLVPKVQLVQNDRALTLNLYIPGQIMTQTPAGQSLKIEMDTAYPAQGEVNIRLNMDAPEEFTLRLRNPAWSENTVLIVNGHIVPAEKGYITLFRLWKAGDEICLTLDMRTKVIRPIAYGSQWVNTAIRGLYCDMVSIYDEEDPLAKSHLALQRGPLMLAQENRLGYSVDTPIRVQIQQDATVDVLSADGEKIPYEHMLAVRVPLENGEYMTVTDYASAGKLWTQESKMAVWMLTK